MPSIIIPILQYGVPAGIEGIRFVREMLDSLENAPTMTQNEFNAKWAETRDRYRAAGAAWEEAGNSPEAKA